MTDNSTRHQQLAARNAALLERVARNRDAMRDEQRKKRKRERASATRRLIIIGATLEAALAAGEPIRNRLDLQTQLAKRLTRNTDRALFDLDP